LIPQFGGLNLDASGLLLFALSVIVADPHEYGHYNRGRWI